MVHISLNLDRTLKATGASTIVNASVAVKDVVLLLLTDAVVALILIVVIIMEVEQNYPILSNLLVKMFLELNPLDFQS